MKVVKGTAWSKDDFLKQLKQLLHDNHVVELNKLINFEGRDQLIENMLIRTEIELASEQDIEKQTELELKVKKKAMEKNNYHVKLKQEEEQLLKDMGLK